MKFVLNIGLVLVLAPSITVAQSINFGDDKSDYANDGQCDDRRFRGAAIASGLDRDDIGRDATDCKTDYDAGKLTLWNFAAALEATQCDTIDFGSDESDYPADGQCDDFRFEGPGADQVMLTEDIGKDATDCSRLCEFGQIALRDY